MLFKFNHNYDDSPFKPQRLAYFADKKSKKDKEAKNQESSEQINNPYLNEESKGILSYKLQYGTDEEREFARAAIDGKLPRNGINTVVKAFEKKPSKEKSSQFEIFRNNLVKGIYSENSGLPKAIAKTLKEAPSNSEEYTYLVEDVLIRNREISGGQEGEFKTNLDRLRHERLGKTDVSEKAEVIREQAGISRAAEDASKVQREVSPFKPWQKGEFPEEVSQKLQQMSIKLQELMKAGASATDVNKAKEIREQIDTLIAQYSPELGAEKSYIETMRGQMFQVYRLARDLGLNLNEIVKAWKLDDDQTGGIKVNPHTGKAEKDMGEIVIHRIWPAYADEDEENYHPDYFKIIKDKNPSGLLMIDFTDANGIRHEAENESNFRNMIFALDGHNELTPEQFEKEIMPHTGYKSVQECLDAQSELVYFTYDSQSENGYPRSTLHKFQITGFDGKKITVNPPVVTLKKEKLSQTTPDNQYQDHIKTDFTLGEFATFLKQNNVERTLQQEEIAEVNRKANEATNQDTIEVAKLDPSEIKEAMNAGILNKEAFTPPMIGESKDVLVYTEKGREKAKVTAHQAADGTTVYTFDPLNAAAGAAIGNVLSRDDAHEKIDMDRRARNISTSLPTAQTNGGMTELSNNGNIVPLTPKEPIRQRAAEKDYRSADAAVQDPQSNHQSVDPSKMSDEDLPEGETDEERQQRQADEAAVEDSRLRAPKPREYEEALTYDEVFKYGGMSKTERGMLATMWRDTRFFSVNDFWEFCKAGYEYYVRRWERRQKEKYSSIGTDLPFFAPEFQRINQAAENEEVNQFQETFDQKGIMDIEDRLRNTGNQDEMKAAFIVLQQKGQLRWDDIEMWKNLNRFCDSKYAIPIPSNGDPRTQVSATDQRTGVDFLKDAIDSIWGEGTYNDWYASNKGAYESGAKKYYEEGKQLEGVQGGHGRRLGILLQMHKKGEWVDPHEYEGLILHSIYAGKSSMQEKIYYMVEGVAAENAYGRTILDIDRMAHINSEMLTKFPLLEYMCANIPRKDGKGSYRFTKEDYKHWANIFDEGQTGNPAKFAPGQAVDDFLWKYVLPSDQTQNRINKTMRNGDLDHDDMFGYMPPASEGVITDATMAVTGSKKFFTIEGYANAFPGFSQYMRSLSENQNKNKLVEAIRSYVRYESIMMNRWKKGDDKYQRMDDTVLDGATIVSTTTPRAYITQMNELIQELASYYSQYDKSGNLQKYANLIHLDLGQRITKNNKDQQEEVQTALEEFGRTFNAAVINSPDKGDAMLSIVKAASLEGMPYMDSAEKDARKAAKAGMSSRIE